MRVMRWGATCASDWPSKVMAPPVDTCPAMARSSVLLPAPLAPTTATISPRPTSSDTPCSALRPL